MGYRTSQLSAAGTLVGTELVELSQLSTTATLTATTISFTNSGNKVSRASGSWSTAGFAVGKSVKISGASNGANNAQSRVLTAVSALDLTFGGTDGNSIVDEAAGATVTVTQWDSVYQPAGTGIDLTKDTDATLAANSNTRVPTQAAVKSYADNAGLRGLRFTSDTDSTADSDPGNGLFKWNNATQASATFLYFDNQTSDAVTISTFWASLGSSGFIYLQQSDDKTKWQLWKWTATPTNGTGYYKFAVTLQANGGSIADNKTVLCEFMGAGGGAGATEFQGLQFTSDTDSTADSDPGNGLFKWNNATQASATVLYFDNQTLDAVSTSTLWASFGETGYLYLQQGDDATKWQVWKWTATPTNGTGYYKFTVTLQSNGGSIADNKTVHCVFVPGSGGGNAGRHMIPISAGSMYPRQTAGCATLAYFAGASDQPDMPYLAFSDGSTSYAEFGLDMPESWNEGTLTFAPVWSHGSTATNFGVTFKLQAVAISNDDTMAATFGTAQASSDTGGTTDDLYIGPESSAITVGGSPAAGDRVQFRLSRVPSDGSDNLAVAARLHGIRLYMTTDQSTD